MNSTADSRLGIIATLHDLLFAPTRLSEYQRAMLRLTERARDFSRASPLLEIGTTCLLCSILLFISRYLLHRKRAYDIAEAPSRSFFGLARDLVAGELRASSQEHLHALHASHGPLFQARWGTDYVLFTNDPVLTKLVLEQTQVRRDAYRGLLFPTPNISTLSSASSEWKRRHKAVRHAYSPTTLQNFDWALQSTAERLIYEINLCIIRGESTPIPLHDLFLRCSLTVLCRVGFEMQCDFFQDDDAFKSFNDAVQELNELTSFLYFPFAKQAVLWNLPLPQVRRFNSTRFKLQVFVWCALDQIRLKYSEQKLTEGSFAKLLMDYAMEHDLSNDEISSEMLNFLLAGYENTANALGGFIRAVCENKEVQDRCHRDLSLARPSPAKTSPKRRRSLSQNILPEFVEAVLKESMRVYPLAPPALRVVVEEEGLRLPTAHLNTHWDSSEDDTKITSNRCLHVYPHSVHLKPGSQIMISSHSLHISTRNWGSDAHIFRPERWLRENDERLASPAAYMGTDRTLGEKDREPGVSFAPFSFGARHCLGMPMALWEMRAVLAELLLHFRFELAENGADRLLVSAHRYPPSETLSLRKGSERIQAIVDGLKETPNDEHVYVNGLVKAKEEYQQHQISSN